MNIKVIWGLVLLVSLACRGRPGAADGGGGGGDDGANIDEVVLCGDGPPVGPGNSNHLQRHVLDTEVFPDALCNDGTPSTLYFRPYTGAANRNKWMINLHGGGACGSGPSCVARWCTCDSLARCPYVEETTGFTRSTMTNDGPTSRRGDGLFLRGDPARLNPFGDWNQVELQYCTSDSWAGQSRSVELSAVHPQTNAPVTFTLHFLGAKVLDADLATLRQDGVGALVYTAGGGTTPLPDLDDATEVVFTGDSAGGAGLITHLDALAALLRANNTACGGGSCPLQVRGLVDATVGPDRSKLDYGAIANPALRTYDGLVDAAAQDPKTAAGRVDQSCLSWHAANAPSTSNRCFDESHVVRHHVTTPFFVRMALRDSLISKGYIQSGARNPDSSPITVSSFAATLHDELAQLGALGTTAEEGASIGRPPGVFAPGCTKHDTIHDTAETFATTIATDGGVTVTLLDVYQAWQAGVGRSVVLTESPSLADTFCP